MSRTRYMLDTNIVSDLVRSPRGRVFDQIATRGSEAVCISIVTAAELRYGRAKKRSPRLLAQVEAILGAIEILPLDVPADTEYAGIRAELEAAGKSIGPNDLPIAAHPMRPEQRWSRRTSATSNGSGASPSKTGSPDQRYPIADGDKPGTFEPQDRTIAGRRCRPVAAHSSQSGLSLRVRLRVRRGASGIPC